MNKLLLLFSVLPAEFTWTQYSDRASLPKSKRERDRLRDLLSRVNEAYLNSAEDRQRYRDLKRIFDEDDVMVEQSQAMWRSSAIALVGLLVLLLVFAVSKCKQSEAMPVDAELREARLKKFT